MAPKDQNKFLKGSCNMANKTTFSTPVKVKIEGKTVQMMTRKIVETPDGATCVVKGAKGRFATLTRKKGRKIFQPA